MQAQRYQIKLYDINNVFKGTIRNDSLLSDITFSKNINGGMGEVTFEVNGKIDISLFDEQLKVKIYETDPISNQTYLIYGGLINNVENHFKGFFFHRIYCYGYISFATKYVLKSPADNYVFDYDGTASNMMKEIIDKLNIEYNNIYNYDATTIVDNTTPINMRCDKTTAFDALNIIRQACTNSYFYIDANGTVYFNEKSSTPQKILAKGRDILEAFQANDLDSIINHVIIEHILGEEEFEDAASIAQWGRRTYNMVEREVGSTTALKMAEEMVQKHKQPMKKTKAIIASQYVSGYSKRWEQLEPGTTVSIRNIDDINITQNLQIAKMTYYKDNIDIEFEETYNNLSNSIAAIAFNVKKKIEKNKPTGGGGTGGPGSGGINGYFDSHNDHFEDSNRLLVKEDISQESSIIRLSRKQELGVGFVSEYLYMNLLDVNLDDKNNLINNNDKTLLLESQTFSLGTIMLYTYIFLADLYLTTKNNIINEGEKLILGNDIYTGGTKMEYTYISLLTADLNTNNNILNNNNNYINLESQTFSLGYIRNY